MLSWFQEEISYFEEMKARHRNHRGFQFSFEPCIIFMRIRGRAALHWFIFGSSLGNSVGMWSCSLLLETCLSLIFDLAFSIQHYTTTLCLYPAWRSASTSPKQEASRAVQPGVERSVYERLLSTQ